MLLFLYFLAGIAVTTINIVMVQDNDWDVSLTNITMGIIFPIHTAIAVSFVWVYFKVQLIVQRIIEKLENRDVDTQSVLNLKNKFFKGDRDGRRKGGIF